MEYTLAQITEAVIQAIKDEGYVFNESQLMVFEQIGNGKLTFDEAREGFNTLLLLKNEKLEFEVKFNLWIVDLIEKSFIELSPPGLIS